jgi:hypothetical protein
MDDGLIKRLQDEDPIAADQILKSFKQISEVVQLNEVVDAETLEKMCVVGGVPKRGTSLSGSLG